MKQYHVIPRNGRWHLYEGNGAVSLAEGSSKADILRTARTYARVGKGRVVVHIETSPDDIPAA